MMKGKKSFLIILAIVFTGLVVRGCVSYTIYSKLTPHEKKMADPYKTVDEGGYITHAHKMKDFLGENHTFYEFLDLLANGFGKRPPVFALYQGIQLKALSELPFYQVTQLEFMDEGFRVLVVNSVLTDIALIVLIILLGFEVFEDKRVGYLAGLLYAIDPLAVLLSTRIRPDSLYAFLLTLSVYALIKAFKTKKASYLAGSAFFMGLCINTRYIALYLPVIFIFALAYEQIIPNLGKIRHRIDAVKNIGLMLLMKKILVYLTIVWLLIVPLYAINYAFHGAFELSPHKGIQICGYYGVDALRERDISLGVINETESLKRGDYRTQYCENPAREILGRRYSKFSFEANRIFMELGKKYLMENPYYFAKASAKGIYMMFIQNPMDLFETKHERSLSVTALVLNMVEYLFFAVGCIKMLKDPRIRGEGIFFFLICAYAAISINSAGKSFYGRYRVPVLPLIFIVSAYGVVTFLKWIVSNAQAAYRNISWR